MDEDEDLIASLFGFGNDQYVLGCLGQFASGHPASPWKRRHST